MTVMSGRLTQLRGFGRRCSREDGFFDAGEVRPGPKRAVSLGDRGIGQGWDAITFFLTVLSAEMFKLFLSGFGVSQRLWDGELW